MKKSGFTLIELVVVVVVLGILAAVAAPRFLNTASDARATTAEAISSALRVGSELVHAKAVIEGQDEGTVTNFEISDGIFINIRSGYPRVASDCQRFVTDLAHWIDFDISAIDCPNNGNSSVDADWIGTVDANMFHFYPKGFSGIADDCYVTYETASRRENGQWVDTDSASIVTVTDGC